MIRRYDLEPNKGVGPIELGMMKSEVLEILGEPEFENNKRLGFQSGFYVDIDANDKVEFIELAPSEEYEVFYKGKNLHKAPAIDVVSLIQLDDKFDETDPELGYSYIFKKLQLSLWR